MPNYLELNDDDKNVVLEQAAQELGRPARVLEKDLWVCWVLSRLFGNDFGSPLTFKGGTSLAKVYGVIHRFSEDVDVTVDNRPWGIDFSAGPGLCSLSGPHLPPQPNVWNWLVALHAEQVDPASLKICAGGNHPADHFGHCLMGGLVADSGGKRRAAHCQGRNLESIRVGRWTTEEGVGRNSHANDAWRSGRSFPGASCGHSFG